MSRAQLSFALVREGPSDDGLAVLIRKVLQAAVRDAGVSVVGDPLSYGTAPKDQVRKVMDEAARPELLFVHKDADSRDHGHILGVIEDAAQLYADPRCVVPVIPVQETEAWAMVDEELIMDVVGSREGHSRDDLGLPSVGKIEDTACPKEVLLEALMRATKDSARERKRTRKRFGSLRLSIFENLEIDGPLSQLPSWQRFRAVAEAAAAYVLKLHGVESADIDGDLGR